MCTERAGKYSYNFKPIISIFHISFIGLFYKRDYNFKGKRESKSK